MSMTQLFLNEDWMSMDKVVDQQCKRARNQQAIANATVKAARVRGYQRAIPFPEIDEDEESSAS